MHKSPIDTLYVDLVDACNLACPTCPRGMRYMKNRKGQMSIDKFEKIRREFPNSRKFISAAFKA